MSERFPLTIYRNNQPVTILNEQEWTTFAENYTILHAAGGIVSNENGEILMIFRYSCWDFPKGKVEKDEEWETAAIREVQEETGVRDITLQEPLPNTYHTYTLHDKPILKITHWYSMRAPSQSLVPQTEEDISQAVWMPQEEVAVRLEQSYASLKGLWAMIR